MTVHRLALIAVVSLVVGVATESRVQARMMFGKDENIHRIQKLGDSGLFLCHKTTTNYFIAGVGISDDGYVLQEEADTKSYLPLDSTKITELQAEGVLPETLPAYSISWFDYRMGYSLYLLVVIVICWTAAAPAYRWLSAKLGLRRSEA